MNLKILFGLSNSIGTGKIGMRGGVSGYSISGVVYDADGTTPVSGATITLGAFSAVSAANGTYTISNISAGTSGSMTCTKTGYLWTAISVAAMSGNLTAQNYANARYAGGGSAANCIIEYAPLGAASLAASKVNLRNPGTNDATAGNNPTFDTALGWVMNGTNNYLRTGWTPGNGNTVIVGFTKHVVKVGTGQKAIFGSIAAGKFFCYYGADTYVIYGNRCAAAGMGNGTSAPEYAVIAITPGKLYVNGELQKDTAQADQVNAEQYIGCFNNGGADGYGASNIAFWMAYDTALTQAQIQIISDSFIPSGSTVMPYGDSKTACTTTGNWPNQLGNAVGESYSERPYRLALAGRTVATAKAAVDAELALKRGTPAYILWNLGVNDAGSLPAEATWKSNAQYIIDAMHTKWPSAKIYFMRVWNRAQPANCATINGWYGDLVTANPGVCFAGPDESVWLEGGDNGVTMTTDGTHYSAAGHAEAKTQWLTVLP